MIAALALLASAAGGIAPASISDIARDGVLQHVADGRDGLWIQSFYQGWFYARFNAPCARLGDSYGLRFDPSPGDRLDKDSAAIADGERCRFASLVKSGPPPKPRRR